MKKRNILIIAFSFLGICLIAIGALTLNLFKSDAQPGNLIVNTDEGNDYIRLTGVKRKISANNTEVVTITATVNPNVVVDDTLNWSIGYSSGTGSVSEYVTMTVSEDTHSVDIAFKKLFNKQIKVTATSKLTPSISASCTIDCYRKTTDIDEVVLYNGDGQDFASNDNNEITLAGITYEKLSVSEMSSNAYTFCLDIFSTVSVGTTGSADDEPNVTISISNELAELLGISDKTVNIELNTDQYPLRAMLLELGLTSHLKNTTSLQKMAQTDHWIDMTFTLNDTAEGATINTYSETFAIKGFNVSDGLAVNSLTLNDTSIVFK